MFANEQVVRSPARLLGAILAILIAVSPAAWAVCGDGTTDAGETCDDGNVNGGDGCAENCTVESERPFIINPETSYAATQLAALYVEFELSGEFLIITGQVSPDGFLPFVVREKDLTVRRVAVPGLNCACTSSTASEELFGPGNIAIGGVFCPQSGQLQPRAKLPTHFEVPESVLVTKDHRLGVVGEDGFTAEDCRRAGGSVESEQHPGVCRGPTLLQAGAAAGPKGSAAIIATIDIRLILDQGTCCVAGVDSGCEDPLGAKGPDGIACTDDDPSGENDPAQKIRIEYFPGVSGTIQSSLKHANDSDFDIEPEGICGGRPCQTGTTGRLFDCDKILSTTDQGADTGSIALGFPILDVREIGDSIVTVRLDPIPGGTFVGKSPTPTPVNTPVPPTNTPQTPTKTPGLCAGDCSHDNIVSIDELVTGVNIGLDLLPILRCDAIDLNRDGQASVDEVVQAVRRLMGGC